MRGSFVGPSRKFHRHLNSTRRELDICPYRRFGRCAGINYPFHCASCFAVAFVELAWPQLAVWLVAAEQLHVHAA